MTLFKTAIRNLKHDPLMNIIAFIQLIAVFMAATVMVSTIGIRFHNYDALKSILESKGFFADFGFGARNIDDSVYSFIYSVDELNSYMNADSVISYQSVVAVQINNENIKTSSPDIMCYDNELIKRCKPRLKSGRWINPDSDKLEVVITDNNAYGWKIGDTLNLNLMPFHELQYWTDKLHEDKYRPIEVEVVGIVESNTEIFGYHPYRETFNDTFRFLYDTHNSHQHNEPDVPTMISSLEAKNRLFPNAEAKINGAFFLYDDDTPDEFIKEKSKLAGMYDAGIVLDLKEINENSKIYLHEELLKMMPVIVILLILVVISAVSVSAIAARRRLKDYAKYYVLGLQWKQCGLVNFLQALTTAAAALIICIIAFFIISFTPLSEFVTIIVDMRLILSLLGILALYLVFSMIMPLIMLNSATPKELLQTE